MATSDLVDGGLAARLHLVGDSACLSDEAAGVDAAVGCEGVGGGGVDAG